MVFVFVSFLRNVVTAERQWRPILPMGELYQRSTAQKRSNCRKAMETAPKLSFLLFRQSAQKRSNCRKAMETQSNIQKGLTPFLPQKRSNCRKAMETNRSTSPFKCCSTLRNVVTAERQWRHLSPENRVDSSLNLRNVVTAERQWRPSPNFRSWEKYQISET